MHLREIQNLKSEFEKARGWDKFPASQVFTHLIEELGEISRHISVEEGYKKVGLGHDAPKETELRREFAQPGIMAPVQPTFYQPTVQRSEQPVNTAEGGGIQGW